MSDSNDIQVLLKALEKVTATASERQPWQEHFERGASVNSKDILNTDIIQGFSGGWASSYSYGEGAQIDVPTSEFGNSTEIPIPVRRKSNKLGQPGYSDVDFVPYNWRTNRYGSKGPALIGSPISFESVGTTLKSPLCDWTWRWHPAGGPTQGPNGGDLLEMDVRPDGAAAIADTIFEGYGISPYEIGGVLEPHGGLYVVISQDGANPGSIPSGSLRTLPQEEHIETARYQIFRVSGVYNPGVAATNGSIELHPSKSLGDYFYIEGGEINPQGHLRGIALIQPFTTRLQAIPGSGAGVGREQTFVFLPPERSAQPDIYPPSNIWFSGGFEPEGAMGDTGAYGGKINLPIPTPIRQDKGTLKRNSGGFTAADKAGIFEIDNVEDWVGNEFAKVVHIYNVELTDTSPSSLADVRQLMGWYQVTDSFVANTLELRRVAEIDPETGRPFFGPGPLHISEVGEIRVYFTLHEHLSKIWDTSFDIDLVEATRLRHLIDPRQVERTEKLVSQTAATFDRPDGASPARADRAIFNTRTFDNGNPILDVEDPGSLEDLGFRVVLYPAKNVSNTLVPDFDRPISSREVLLDPDVNEPQYLDIDYSAGVVRLSHAPAIGTSEITPNGILEIQNPRKEAVLFAACVPFSQEPSQRGAGPRMVTKVAGQDTDVFSTPLIATLDISETTFLGPIPYFDEIVLTSLVEDIPETGMFDIVGNGGASVASFGTWSYLSTRVENFGGGDVTVLEGIASTPTATSPSASAYQIVFRREVYFGQRANTVSAEIDDVRYDTTYGSAHRASTVRLLNATSKYELDGSISLNTSGSAGVPLLTKDEGVNIELDTQTLNFTGVGITASSAGGNQVNVNVDGTVGVQDEGGLLTPNAHFLNFEGNGVNATPNGLGVDVTIPGSIEVQDESVSVATTAEFLNFLGSGIAATPNGSGIDVTLTGTIEVQDDSSVEDSAAEFLNFIGDGVTISTNGSGIDVDIPGSVEVQDESSSLTQTAEFLNFLGGGVTAVTNGSGVDITIPGAGPNPVWTLIDTQSVSGSAVTTITLSGLDSDNDGIYCIQGRLVLSGSQDLTLFLGNSVLATKTISVKVDDTAITNLDQGGWFICEVDPTVTGDQFCAYIEIYIYPFHQLHGATEDAAGYKYGFSRATIYQDALGNNLRGFHNHTVELNDSTSFTFIDLDASSIEQGTEVSIYKLRVT